MTRAYPSLLERFWAKVDKSSVGGCWLWTGAKARGGYGNFYMRPDHPVNALRDGRGRMCAATRVSYLLHYGVWPGTFDVCHYCDNPPCVRPDHLWLGSHAENMADMTRKGRDRRGRGPTGERHPRCKLLDSEVRDILRELDSGVNYRALAARYGLSEPYIHMLGRGIRRQAITGYRAKGIVTR